MNIELGSEASGELAIKLSSSLAEVYFQLAKWEETVQICEWTLQQWKDTPHTFELLRAVYLLINSHYQLGDSPLSVAIASEWMERLASEDPLNQWILQVIRANALHWSGNAGTNDYEGPLSMQIMPNSYMSTRARQTLALLHFEQNSLDAAEEQLWIAREAYILPTVIRLCTMSFQLHPTLLPS